MSPLNREAAETRNLTYLKTQVGLIYSSKVINPALADPLVVNYPLIRYSRDPKAVLLNRLRVHIIEDTNLIGVSLELPNPDEAVGIVRAVVESYLAQNMDYSRSANRDITESLKQQLAKIGDEIKSKRDSVRDLYRKGQTVRMVPQDRLRAMTATDPTQPTFRVIPEEQLARLTDQIIKCDLEYLDALANLEATRLVRDRNLDQISDDLNNRAEEELRKDPRIAVMMEQIDEAKKLGKSKDTPPSPAVLAAREKVQKLYEDYAAVWASRGLGIRKRLAQGDAGLLSESRIRELEVAVEKARKKKVALAQHFEKIQVEPRAITDDSVDAAVLNHHIQTLLGWEENVKKNLEQLKFEASQDKYRVVLVDAASAPKTPTKDKRIKVLALAATSVFLLLLGAFFVREIVSPR